MKRKLLVFTLIFTFFSTFLFSQEYPKVGLSASIQSSQFGILIPIWLGEKFAVVPAFQISHAEKIGTDLGFAIAPRFYLKKDKLSPYFGLRAGALINKPSLENKGNKETQLDLLGGLAFGGEYFFSENFSFGVEAQVNITKSDEFSYRFGNPDMFNINTGAMVYATIYF